MAPESDVQRVEIKLDLDKLAAIMNIGVRRASAFLKLGTQIDDADVPADMSLAGGIAFSFWPKDLPESTRKEIADEFRAWLIGSCLRELDQYLGMFLDEAWRLIQLSELHGKRLPSSEQVEFDRKFVHETNTARKYGVLREKVGAEIADDCYASFSLVRNSLTHGIGRVRARDCNSEGQLDVMWISPEMVIQDGDVEYVCRAEVFDGYQVRSSEGATVGVRFVKRSKNFKLGQKIEFSPHELAEICFFYKQQADVVRAAIFEFLKSKGILPNPG